MPARWYVNSERSSAEFSARGFWGTVRVSGRFDGLSGSVRLGADGEAKGELLISARTLNTGLPLRDRHLKSATFLGTRRYPEIRFGARGLEAAGDGHLIHGTLSVRDRLLELALPVTVAPDDGGRLTVSAEIPLDRAELGVEHSPLGMIRGPVTVRAMIVLEPER